MPEIVTDPPSPSCYHLFPRLGIQESQQLGPDPSLPRARDARGRFAQGSSGNPRGRPPLDLIDRKPHLLGPLAAQLLPPPPASIEPDERLGIDLPSLRTAKDCRQVLADVLAAIARGEVTPTEGARIAKRVDARLRVVRRLARAGRNARCLPFPPPGSKGGLGQAIPRPAAFV
jgi:hypothetical protein